MKKIFCDCCSKEITKNNLFELTKTGNYSLKGTLYINASPYNSLGTRLNQTIEGSISLNYVGDLCKHCIIDLINQSDDRPRAA